VPSNRLSAASEGVSNVNTADRNKRGLNQAVANSSDALPKGKKASRIELTAGFSANKKGGTQFEKQLRLHPSGIHNVPIA
jgi:hypothetical protein